MIRSATPFPLVSLFFMFIGFVLNNIGHIRPHHTILAFVSGIFFILSGTLPLSLPPLSVWHVSFVWLMFVCLSGLSLVVGLVLYISSINDEMFNRTKSNEAYFSYKYGWSFAFAAISFLLTEVKSSFIQTLPFTVILLSLFSIIRAFALDWTSLQLIQPESLMYWLHSNAVLCII